MTYDVVSVVPFISFGRLIVSRWWKISASWSTNFFFFTTTAPNSDFFTSSELAFDFTECRAEGWSFHFHRRRSL